MPTIKPDNPRALQPEQHVRRSRGEDAVPARGHSTEHVPADFRTINGWGADLDPANRPSFPKELPSTVTTVRGEVREWQQPTHRIHVSNEHPDLTPAFGDSCPPKGLSGLLRDYAYEYGEGANRRWLTLMLADRIDIIEHLITDAFRGRPDNWVREKGWTTRFFTKSDNRLQRKHILTGLAVAGAVAAGFMLTRAMRNGDYD
jgi:hypothetical protein